MSSNRAAIPLLVALTCTSCGHADSSPAAPPDGPAVAVPARKLYEPESRALARDGAPVLGHVLVPSTVGLLAKLRAHVAPAAMLDTLTPEGLIRQLTRDGGAHPRLVQSLDLQRPFGCVVGDLGAQPDAFACVFGYTGGATALVRELGAEPSADGHAVVLSPRGGAFYLDALGADVVLSGRPEFFASTRSYLARNLVGRAADVRDELEVVVFTRELYTRYGAAIERHAGAPDPRKQAELDELKKYLPPAASHVLDALDTGKREFDRLNARELAEQEMGTLSLSLGEHGAALRWQFVPTANGRFPAASLSRGRRVDPAFVAALPSGSLMVFAQNLEPRAAVAWNAYSTGGATEEEVQNRMRALAVTRSTLAGAPVSVDAIAREFAEEAALYDGHMALALLEQPGAPFGLGLLDVYRLGPGGVGRDAWLAWTRRSGADTVLAPALRKYVSWRFSPAAYDVGGFPVDRWTIRLDRRLFPRDVLDGLARVAPTLVTDGLHIDRLEAHGQVYFAVAPGAEEPLLRRALAARDGRGSLHDDPRLRQVMRRAGDANVVMAWDLAGSLDWFERLLVHFGAIEAGTLPRSLGRGLDDVYVQFVEPDSGLVGGELVVGPGVLAALQRWSP